MSSEIQHATAGVNGTTLHYVSAGAGGPPVLLVHGFPETWWAFRELIPLLADHHRVYAVDLRGFGDSEVADDTFSSAVAAEDLHALIDHLGAGPMHIVGQDITGGVVYRLAAAHSDDVLSLTAVESGLAGFGMERLADVTNGGVWYLGALAAPGVASLLFERAARAFIGDYLYPMYRVALPSDDITEYARTYGRAGGFSGAAGLYRSALREGDELRQLSKTPLKMPVTAIGAAGGGFTHAGFSGAAGRDVADVRLDGVGHYVAQQAPARLAAALLQAFARA